MEFISKIYSNAVLLKPDTNVLESEGNINPLQTAILSP